MKKNMMSFFYTFKFGKDGNYNYSNTIIDVLSMENSLKTITIYNNTIILLVVSL